MTWGPTEEVPPACLMFVPESPPLVPGFGAAHVLTVPDSGGGTALAVVILDSCPGSCAEIESGTSTNCDEVGHRWRFRFQIPADRPFVGIHEVGVDGVTGWSVQETLCHGDFSGGSFPIEVGTLEITVRDSECFAGRFVAPKGNLDVPEGGSFAGVVCDG